MATARLARSETSPAKLLLVEGSDDVQVVRHLVSANIPDLHFEIWARQGVDELIRAIPLQYLAQGRVALGILVDADDNLAFRWNDVASSLRVVGVELPREPVLGGTIIDTGKRVGVWVMPDNTSSGELEDFIFKMIPQPDPVWLRAERFIDDIPVDDRKFLEHKSLRAKVHAWMATRSRPRPMWSGISENDLVLETNSTAFLNWLRRLFGEDLA